MEENASSEKATRRLKKLLGEQQEQVDVIKAAKRQARGAGAVKRKVQAKLLAEALAEATLIDGEISEIQAALPDMIETEGRLRAEALITSITTGAPALASKLVKVRKEEFDASCELVRRVEAAGKARVRLMVSQLEIRLLRLRWPELKQPPVVEVPDLQDVAPPILKVVRTTPLGPKTLTVAHTASADADERKRDGWKALVGWLAKHRNSLSTEAREIFASAGVPDWKSEGNKERKASRRRREQEAEEEFSQRFGEESDRAERRPRVAGGGLGDL